LVRAVIGPLVKTGQPIDAVWAATEVLIRLGAAPLMRSHPDVYLVAHYHIRDLTRYEAARSPPPKSDDDRPAERPASGMPPKYTREDVMAAFRVAVKKTHPDVGGTASDFIEAVNERDRLLAMLGEQITPIAVPLYYTSGATKKQLSLPFPGYELVHAYYPRAHRRDRKPMMIPAMTLTPEDARWVRRVVFKRPIDGLTAHDKQFCAFCIEMLGMTERDIDIDDDGEAMATV